MANTFHPAMTRRSSVNIPLLLEGLDPILWTSINNAELRAHKKTKTINSMNIPKIMRVMNKKEGEAGTNGRNRWIFPKISHDNLDKNF